MQECTIKGTRCGSYSEQRLALNICSTITRFLQKRKVSTIDCITSVIDRLWRRIRHNEHYCRQLSPDVVLIDGNEYTGWGEFQVAMKSCRPKYLALHDTGTLKTAKVEKFIQEHPKEFEMINRGVDRAAWAVYQVSYLDHATEPRVSYLNGVPRFSDADLHAILKKRGINEEIMYKNDEARRKLFQDVYTNQVWTHGDSSVPKSGSGSTLAKTQATRNALKEVILRYNVTSIVDAPCGDLTWMRSLFPFVKEHGVKYTGVDIVSSEIDRLRKELPGHQFQRLDMVHTVLPKVDLIFSRQALQHMNAEDNVRVINRWQESGARFVLQTTYRTASNSNYQQVAGGTNSLINFETDPYNFPSPIETWVEQDRAEFTELLALWTFPTTDVQRSAAQTRADPRWASIKIWSTDFHISPIATMKSLIPEPASSTRV